MLRKIGIILFLAAALVALLIFKPWEREMELPPRFFDRLPEADVIGKSNIYELARSLSPTMYYYKTPLREFLTHEFILSQSKNYGLDLQKPVFFFMNQENWELNETGIMCIISDTTKLRSGFDNFVSLGNIKDTLVGGNKVYLDPQYRLFYAYGSNWLFIYKGESFQKQLDHILNAKRNEIPPRWRNFLNDTQFDDKVTVAEIHTKELKEMGVESSTLLLSNDSTSISLLSTIHSIDTLNFSMKRYGPMFKPEAYTRNLVNLHFNIERLREHPEDPLYKLIERIAKKVHFPVKEFLNSWEGDIAFRQGGYHTVKEYFVRSELDENFNITEIQWSRNVRVSGYSLFISTNANRDKLLRLLDRKGILTKEDRKYRLLFSPPMSFIEGDDYLMFYTSSYAPNIYYDTLNTALWTHERTGYQFKIDSTGTKSIYGSVKIPLDRIIQDELPKYQRK